MKSSGKPIELTRGKIAWIDAEDYSLVSRYRWHAKYSKGNWYAAARVSGEIVFMHNLLLGRRDGYEVDHEDQDGLNNQRYNLRHSTYSQNRANVKTRKDNSSGYKGVCFHPKSGRWRAYIQVNKRWKSLKSYKTPQEAALAYNTAAKEAFGEFAWLNPI